MIGGDTVMFERGDKTKQLLAVQFKRGRCVFGPFHCVWHGATAYKGGRAAIGAYVDRRIVHFCTLYRLKGGRQQGGALVWEEREEDDWRQQVEALRSLCPNW